jgi:hypothetical protein
MPDAATTENVSNEKVSLGGQAPFLYPLLGLGVVGLAVALGSVLTIDAANPGFGRFYHAYLLAFMFCLSISLGCLFFVIVGHIFRAGWSVNVRRIFETFACAIPILGILSIPFFVTVWRGDAKLYHWAVPVAEIEHHGDGHDDKHGDGHGDGHGNSHGNEHKDADKTAPHSMADRPAVILASDAPAPAETPATTPPANQGRAGGGPLDSARTFEEIAKDAQTNRVQPSVPTNEISPETAELKKPIGYHTAYGYKKFDEFTQAKYAYLNPTSFTVRVVGYFVIWTLMAWYFYRLSVKQDSTGDPELSRKMSRWAPVCMVVFGSTLYFASVDLVMTLDHHWYSSMFGIQFFAGCAISAFASVIVTVNLLQRAGYLTQSVSTEHLHDLGKLMFGFIVFWAYTTYSQYMLIWYANIPETTPWFERRGATSSLFAPDGISYWTGISLILLFCHFLLPFPFLLSRHIKRNKDLLLFGAVWMLFFHLVDLYWVIIPELNNGKFYLGLPEIGAVVGLVGLFVGYVSYKLAKANLRPVKDPRAHMSFAFQNM